MKKYLIISLILSSLSCQVSDNSSKTNKRISGKLSQYCVYDKEMKHFRSQNNTGTYTEYIIYMRSKVDTLSWSVDQATYFIIEDEDTLNIIQ